MTHASNMAYVAYGAYGAYSEAYGVGVGHTPRRAYAA